MIPLGSLVRDKFTGLTGIATGRTEWMFGCNRICIEPTELKDGKPIEGQWFDEQRVELVTEPAAEAERRRTGGPQADPGKGMTRP